MYDHLNINASQFCYLGSFYTKHITVKNSEITSQARMFDRLAMFQALGTQP